MNLTWFWETAQLYQCIALRIAAIDMMTLSVIEKIQRCAMLLIIPCTLMKSLIQKLDSAPSNARNSCKMNIIRRSKTDLLAQRNAPADDDFISRFVSKILPTPEDIGLSRYNQSSRPENYPCVKDEWAAKLKEDSADPDMLLIRQVLAKTNLEFRPLACLYDADKDGWKAKSFHSKVDKKGPCVVLAKAMNGGVYGGYNPTGWVNYGEYRGSIAAFLYVFPDGDTNLRPLKLAKIAGAGLAQIDDGCGPKFGMEGLTIPLQPPNFKKARSKLGLYYEKLPAGTNTLFKGKAIEEDLVSLKVFGGVYGKDEKIPYSDAMPFSLN